SRGVRFTLPAAWGLTKMRTFSNKSIMAAIAAGLMGLGAAGAASVGSNKKFYADDPIWSTPQPVPVSAIASRKLNEYYHFLENTFFRPGERAPHHGIYLRSQGINTVDEVPDSAWYTNRHVSRAMTLAELKAGPGDSHPPAEGKWTVVAAKNEGITPGFRIRD